MLDSVPSIEPTEPARNHALFGIAPEGAPVANGTSTPQADSKKKKKKKKKSDGETKKHKNKKAKGKKAKGKKK